LAFAITAFAASNAAKCSGHHSSLSNVPLPRLPDNLLNEMTVGPSIGQLSLKKLHMPRNDRNCVRVVGTDIA
jgi:hypothetical protein